MTEHDGRDDWRDPDDRKEPQGGREPDERQEPEPQRPPEPEQAAEPEPEQAAEPGREPQPAPQQAAEPASEFAPAVEPEPVAEPEAMPESAPAGEPAAEPEIAPEPEPEPESALVVADAGAEAVPPTGPSDGHAAAATGGPSFPPISRRTFLAAGAAVACGAVGAFAIAQAVPLPPGVDDTPVVEPAPNWTFVADTSKCIGCGLCVAACKEENNVPEEAEFARTWIERHIVGADGAVYVDSPEGGINGFPRESEAPGAKEASVIDAFFEPRLCMQCAESPCTVVCPVGATFRTAEGVILVDARRCIGCGYCVVSCPYGARYLVPAGDRSPSGIVGVADKCTWCYHRITKGRVPACVEVCPVGARKFGDLNDPASPIHDVLKGKETHQLHPEFGTQPRVVYIGSTRDGREPA